MKVEDVAPNLRLNQAKTLLSEHPLLVSPLNALLATCSVFLVQLTEFEVGFSLIVEFSGCYTPIQLLLFVDAQNLADVEICLVFFLLIEGIGRRFLFCFFK